MDDSTAIAIARDAIQGRVTPAEDAPVTVHRQRSFFRVKSIVVEFGEVLPPGARGGDFAARVTIDPKNGQVGEVLAGS